MSTFFNPGVRFSRMNQNDPGPKYAQRFLQIAEPRLARHHGIPGAVHGVSDRRHLGARGFAPAAPST